jgi:hypothetical protein
MSRDGCIRILQSTDGANWVQAALLSRECDDRDPEFSARRERLVLYSPEWLPGEGRRPELRRGTAVTSSKDGDAWLDLQTCTQPNVTSWRPCAYDGMHCATAYSDAGRDDMDGWRSRLRRSPMV